MRLAGLPGTAIAFALCSICETAPAQQGTLSGSVAVGTRSVELAGTTNKYREDVNLDSGVRLFDVNLNYRSAEAGGPVDDLTFSANNLGGDPYENIHFSVRKYGAYRLRLDRRRSSYFYEDTILPVALASVNSSTGGDFHHFDFERVRDSAALEIDLAPATRVTLGLERQTRSGESTTSLDIERDEFELHKPLDESLESLRLGVEHAFERVTLIFEEEVSDFRNASELFLPGASPGQNTTTNPAALQFFFLDQSYDYDSRSHLLRAIAKPTSRIDLAAIWRRADLDLELNTRESSLGTTFTGAPFATETGGPGSAVRDMETIGFDFGFAVGERARIVAATRSSRLDQRGLSFFGPDQSAGRWDIETDGIELGAEIALGERTMLAAGRSAESRDVDFAQLQNGVGTSRLSSTDRTGFFARLRHETEAGLELSASIEDNSIDDPFSLAAPSDSRRYRVATRYAWASGFALQGSWQSTDVGNDLSGWAADTDQTDLRASYRRERLELSAGIVLMQIDRRIDQLVTGGTIQILFPIAYGADARMRDIAVRWQAHERVVIGGSFRSYDNRRSYPLERDDHRLFVEYALPSDYQLELVYRDIDYAEDQFDAYDADILELALRLNW